MRFSAIIVVVMIMAGVLAGAPARHVERHEHARHTRVSRHTHPYRSHWRHATIGKGAVGRVAAGAAINQARNSPRKYGGGAAGFGKRMGAGLASNAVGRTVEHGVAAKLHEDLHYHRSNKRGVGPRLAYALKSTVVTRNVKTGKTRPAAGRLAGHAAAGAFTQGVLAAGSGAATAGVGVAADAGANVVREFAPHRKSHAHKVRAKKMA